MLNTTITLTVPAEALTLARVALLLSIKANRQAHRNCLRVGLRGPGSTGIYRQLLADNIIAFRGLGGHASQWSALKGGAL